MASARTKLIPHGTISVIGDKAFLDLCVLDIEDFFYNKSQDMSSGIEPHSANFLTHHSLCLSTHVSQAPIYTLTA